MVPKPIRQRLGFVPGEELELRERDGLLEIRHVPTAMTLVARRGAVVGAPQAPSPAVGRDRPRHAGAVALDTSVVVAAFASWHEGHDSAVATLARPIRGFRPTCSWTYSVLTRLPPPHRSPPEIAEAFLRDSFPALPLTLPSPARRYLVGLAARAGISGDAIYDALVAATAKCPGATLFTRDRRAVAAYEAVGVRYEFVG